MCRPIERPRKESRTAEKNMTEKNSFTKEIANIPYSPAQQDKKANKQTNTKRKLHTNI